MRVGNCEVHEQIWWWHVELFVIILIYIMILIFLFFIYRIGYYDNIRFLMYACVESHSYIFVVYL